MLTANLMPDGEGYVFVDSNGKDARSYKLSYGAKGNGAGFSAKTFLDYIGFDYSETRSIPAEWNEHEPMFEVKIPDDYLTQERRPVVPLEVGKKQVKHA